MLTECKFFPIFEVLTRNDLMMKTNAILSFAVVMLAALTLNAQPADNYKVVDGETMVTRYYEDGSVREQGTYDGKLLDGQWKEFFQDGTLKTQAYFKDGIFGLQMDSIYTK